MFLCDKNNIGGTMGRYLNVGLLQSESKDSSFDESLKRIELSVDNLMTGMNRPDIIVGPEMNIGLKIRRYNSGSCYRHTR